MKLISSMYMISYFGGYSELIIQSGVIQHISNFSTLHKDMKILKNKWESSINFLKRRENKEKFVKRSGMV